MSDEVHTDQLDQLNFSFKRTVPQIIQSEAAECGLACLAMICGYHGYHTDLLTLRQSYPISTNGVTLADLIDIADLMKLKSRALSLDLEDLKKLRLPCILHWDLNHFVVLTAVHHNKVIIHDPARGRYTLNFEEFSNHFTGVALELWPTTAFNPVNEKKTLKLFSLFSNVDGLTSFLIKLFCFTVIIEVINILTPIGTQLILDHVIISEDKDLLTLICIGLLASILLKTFISAIRSWLTIINDSLINAQWSSSLFEHLFRLPLAYFEKRKLGDIQSRFTSLDQVRETFTSGIVKIVIDGIMSIILLIMMYVYGAWLMWVVLGFNVVYYLMRISTYSYYKKVSEEKIVKEAKAHSHFMESLYGISTIKALNLAKKRSHHWFNLKIDEINANIRITRFDMVFEGLSNFIAAIDEVVILWLGASMVISGHLSLGMLIAFTAYRGQFSERSSNLVNVLLKIRMLTLHCERIADIALSKTEPVTKKQTVFQEGEAVGLIVQNLSFRYDKISPFIMNQLSFKVAPGEHVAITGASGTGKTTLIKILAGLTPATSGKVLVNHMDIDKIGVNNYRDHIACVLQDDKLFSGSILDNIASFDAPVDVEWAIECAQMANIHNEIMHMPMNYQSIISELGGSLSGGQKQRILIARALYRKPLILFLDEATSHLDVENEQKINTAIAALNITRVIVAHRPSTIASAKRVIWLRPNHQESTTDEA